MIAGRFTRQLEPIIEITLHGPDGLRTPMSALLDTGFNGWLALPRATITELKLPRYPNARFKLADDRSQTGRQFGAVISWEGTKRAVLVLEMEGGPLIGMALVKGSDIELEVRPGGEITIETGR